MNFQNTVLVGLGFIWWCLFCVCVCVCMRSEENILEKGMCCRLCLSQLDARISKSFICFSTCLVMERSD